jgi:hypothetical protein
MINRDDLSGWLTTLPGLLTPAARRGGVWHVQARPDVLADTMRRLFEEAGATLFLAAGEDRLRADELRAHYL